MRLVCIVIALQLACAAALAPASALRGTPTLRSAAAVRSAKYTMQADGRRASGDWAVPAIACQPVMYWSLYTLKTTGCGLPAGPFGAVGAIEGVSYLAVIGIAGASLATKAKTGSGLKAGPGGLLGLAEGLAFTAIVVGLVVLAFQFADYGYLPNAIPVEGGRCD